MDSNGAIQPFIGKFEMTTNACAPQNNGLTWTGDTFYFPNAYYPTAVWPYSWYVPQPPTVCCGDVHVFPCPHCDKCKCGAATMKRKRTPNG